MTAATSRYVRLLLTAAGREAWTPPTLSVRARHLLEVIAHYADLDGEAFPAVPTIAERMGITPSNVRRARAELVAAGIIAVAVGGGKGHTNTYRLPVQSPARPIEDPANPRASARVASSTSRAVARGLDHPQPARHGAANPRATARRRSIEDPRSKIRDATPQVPEPAWVEVMASALAADNARRAAGG